MSGAPVGDRDPGTSVVYERPAIRDFGSLSELTRASGTVGAEDGGNKMTIHHESNPMQP